MKRPDLRVTRTQLAAIVGCTPDRISRYISEGLKTLKTGGGRGHVTVLDLGVAVRWILNRRAGTLDQARTRLAVAQAEKTERENRVRASQLVEVAEVTRDFTDCANTLKARLRRIPDAIADRVVTASAGGPHAVKALLLTEIDEALRELAKRADAT